MRTSSVSPRPETYGNVPITPWHMIERLHDDGFDAGLQASRDGVTVWIGERGGDAGDRIRAQRKFARDEFDDIASWLAAEADRLGMSS